MQKTLPKILTTSIVTAIFLYGCTAQITSQLPGGTPNPTPQPTPPTQTAAINQEFTLVPGQTTSISGTNLDIYFLDVDNDSRCPTDNTCPNPGTVGISLKITKNGQPTQYPISVNLKSNQDIDDDYNLQFLKIDPERGKQFQQISKENYRATLKVISTAPPVPVTQITNPDGIIFPKESANYHPGFDEVTTDLWSPTIDDAKKAEQIVQKCISNKDHLVDDMIKDYPEDQKKHARDYEMENIQNIAKNYADYKRQYVGYNGKNGHKFIWINFLDFPDSDDLMLRSWKKGIMSVMDGGSGFFNVLVDIESENCAEFSVNGVA